MSATHVFLGPSLSWEEGLKILPDATFLPPAKAGDIYIAVKGGAQVIAIIDGFFEQVPAVWHKEILYALSLGVHVFGASSMGALRAAELHPFGMVGIGRIFEAYRDGACEDDDEVAVIHAGQESAFEALSEAMVNVRDALSEALRRGFIGKTTHNVIACEMKRRNYPQRSWLLVPEIAQQQHLPRAEVDVLMDFVMTERPNRKRLDAIELLTELRRFIQAPVSPFEPNFDFEATVFWDQLVAGVRTAPGRNSGVAIDDIRSHVGVVEDDAEAIYHGALLLYLVVKEAHRVDLTSDPEHVERVTERFWQTQGLVTKTTKEEWLRKNHLGDVEFSALMEVLTLVESVAKHHSIGLDAFLPAELQRRGQFESVAAAIVEKRRALVDFGLTFPSAEDVGTTTDALLTWYEKRFRSFGSSFEDHLNVRRAYEATRFVREVLAEYIREGNHIVKQVETV
jgi:hypothetical protein